MRRVLIIPFISLLPLAAWTALGAENWSDWDVDGVELADSWSPLRGLSNPQPAPVWSLEESVTVVPRPLFSPETGFSLTPPTAQNSGPIANGTAVLKDVSLATDPFTPQATFGAAVDALPAPIRQSTDEVVLPIVLVGGTLLVVMATTFALLFQRPRSDRLTTAVVEVQNLAYGAPTSRSAKADVAALSKILRRVIASNEAPDELLIPLHDLLKRCESARHSTTRVTESTLLNVASRATTLLKNAQQATSRRPS